MPVPQRIQRPRHPQRGCRGTARDAPVEGRAQVAVVFETVLARDGAVHRLGAHLDRLLRSLAAIGMRPPHDRDGFAKIVEETVTRNDLRDAYVKLIVTRGSNGTPLLDPAGCVPTVICLARPHTDDDPARLARIERGLTAKTTAVRRPPADVLDPRIKSLNYLNLVLARIEARAAGADEVFLCSTAIGLIPVVVVDGRTIGIGRSGPVTTDLLTTYLAALREENA